MVCVEWDLYANSGAWSFGLTSSAARTFPKLVDTRRHQTPREEMNLQMNHTRLGYNCAKGKSIPIVSEKISNGGLSTMGWLYHLFERRNQSEPLPLAQNLRATKKLASLD